MAKMNKMITILMADDDPDDRVLVQEAFKESKLRNHLFYVKDGEELLDYLEHRGKYATPIEAPRPDLILLDLNMPKKDGREALKEIKADPELRQIPVVVLTTSHIQEDIYHTYDLGGSSYITKPASFEALVEVIQSLSSYWGKTVQLPPENVR